MIDIFIPSYHRATHCKSVQTMIKYGWEPSKITVFVDDEEPDNVAAYQTMAVQTGINLHVFSIQEARENYDFIHRASPSRRAAGMCRNTFHKYAIEKGIRFYVVMDDDTSNFVIKPLNKSTHMLRYPSLINEIFDSVVSFMDKHHIGCFALPQAGDFIGGTVRGTYLNKVMNTTFYDTTFVHGGEAGVQDDDTTQFVQMHIHGLFTGCTGYGLALNQTMSATQAGGLTDLYKECKLLNKALVTVIQCPSAIRAIHQPKNGWRIHHQIKDKYIRPRVLKIGKGKKGNIAWDTYPEDVPFTLRTFNDWRCSATSK